MKPLSETQRAILDFITSYQKRNGFIPSYAEMAANVGLHSSASVSYQLDQLAAKGYIARSFGKARAIKIKTLGEK